MVFLIQLKEAIKIWAALFWGFYRNFHALILHSLFVSFFFPLMDIKCLIIMVLIAIWFEIFPSLPYFHISRSFQVLCQQLLYSIHGRHTEEQNMSPRPSSVFFHPVSSPFTASLLHQDPLSNCRHQFSSPITVPRDLTQQEACGEVGHGVHSLT